MSKSELVAVEMDALSLDLRHPWVAFQGLQQLPSRL